MASSREDESQVANPKSTTTVMPRRTRFLRTALLLFFVSGCQTSDFGVQQAINTGMVRIEPTDQQNVVRISMLNTYDFDYDGNKREDRLKIVRVVMKDKCSNPTVIREDSVDEGTYTFTTKRRVRHYMYTTCP